jgi:hypothetical protein
MSPQEAEHYISKIQFQYSSRNPGAAIGIKLFKGSFVKKLNLCLSGKCYSLNQENWIIIPTYVDSTSSPYFIFENENHQWAIENFNLEENLFSEIISLKKAQRKFPGLFKAAFDVRKYSWDLGFNLPDSFSSRLLFHCLPIAKKTFHKNWQGVNSLKHKSQLYLDLLND